MDGYLQLGPSDIVDGRPFTHPDASGPDLAAMSQMLDRLRSLVSRPDGLPDEPRPLILQLREDDRRGHQVVIANPEALRTMDEFAVVGFFGRQRPGVDPAPMTAVDSELVADFPRHPYVVSYSSLELADGNWGNLVLLTEAEGRERWMENQKHAHASRELAPKFYADVRLHNAALRGGLSSGAGLSLLRTKYYDFRDIPAWRAVRELSAG